MPTASSPSMDITISPSKLLLHSQLAYMHGGCSVSPLLIRESWLDEFKLVLWGCEVNHEEKKTSWDASRIPSEWEPPRFILLSVFAESNSPVFYATERENKALCSLVRLHSVHRRMIWNKVVAAWGAAIARWCRSSHRSGPRRAWRPRTAPRRCSRGCCGCCSRCGHWGDPCPAGWFSRCCLCPSCRSGGCWRRCPSRLWSSRRRPRFLAWSQTRIWGPWRISPNPLRSAPENNVCVIIRKCWNHNSPVGWVCFCLTASTKLLALPLFCKRERPSAGSCRCDGEWLRLGGMSWPCVYHKLLFTAVGTLPTLSDLCQSTCRVKQTPQVTLKPQSNASWLAPVRTRCGHTCIRGV